MYKQNIKIITQIEQKKNKNHDNVTMIIGVFLLILLNNFFFCNLYYCFQFRI